MLIPPSMAPFSGSGIETAGWVLMIMFSCMIRSFPGIHGGSRESTPIPWAVKELMLFAGGYPQAS